LGDNQKLIKKYHK